LAAKPPKQHKNWGMGRSPTTLQRLFNPEQIATIVAQADREAGEAAAHR
jgi:hypothetical protein